MIQVQLDLRFASGAVMTSLGVANVLFRDDGFAVHTDFFTGARVGYGNRPNRGAIQHFMNGNGNGLGIVDVLFTTSGANGKQYGSNQGFLHGTRFYLENRLVISFNRCFRLLNAAVRGSSDRGGALLAIRLSSRYESVPGSTPAQASPPGFPS